MAVNRSVVCESVIQELSHLGSVSIDTISFANEIQDEFVVITKILRGWGDEVRRTEYVTHRGVIYLHPEISVALSQGHYFPADMYAEAQADFFERSKELKWQNSSL